VNGPLRDDAADVPLVPVLRGVSFELRVGEPTALVGGSGAGKSTIVSLICGFARPTSGRILVNGVDLRELPAEEYRSRIAAVLHQDFVLSRSFEENLAYRDPAETRDAEIEAVARQLDLNEVRERDLRKRERSREKVSADEFWSKLGLPSDLLAEGALQLSAGERQRVAIARQLLHESHVWILDEATANLDGRSEDLVFEQLAHIEPLLLLTVSHRLSCVRRMQRVLVLAEGRIVACGTHDELIADDPTYQALFGPQIHDPAWSVATSGEERAL
jgi:ABC-type multidrug transport system fused ATPase/permease subunit